MPVPHLPSAVPGLPGPQAVDPAALQLPASAEEGQLCAGTLTALPEHLLALQQGPSVQHRGLAEKLVSEGYLQES